MNDRIRRKAFYYLVLVTIGMILLSANLPDLQFQPGMPIPGAESSPVSDKVVGTPETYTIDIGKVPQIYLGLVFPLILIIVFVGLVKNIRFKNMMKWTAGFLFIALLCILLNQIEFASPAASTGVSQEIGVSPSFSYAVAPIGDPPAKLFGFVTILLLLGGAIFVIWLFYQTLHPSKKDDLIATEAGAALRAIEEGDDLKNTIIRCYLQMERIAREEQGIERAESATPREFEYLMATKGIPLPPIHQLTHLFEKVRYGGKVLDLQDEQAAIDCLSAIRIACASKGQKAR